MIAFLFWNFDMMIHYFIYDEPELEFIPDDLNELWMRTTIVVLIIAFGIYTDMASTMILKKQRELEAARIYKSMLYATHHILNNLLSQMQLFKIEASRCKDFDQNVIKKYDKAVKDTSDLIARLSRVEIHTEENIWASIDPEVISAQTKKNSSSNSSD